ncbi:ABC transporter substrate-binding protein, partial [bacterium]|nr:ABC transporter substrate-binding protein [bacterium]
MKKRFLFSNVLLSLLVVLAIGSDVFAWEWPWEKGANVGHVREEIAGPIKIGFMGNLSSPFSLSSKGAAQMAIDEINASGGIMGKKLELIIEDTKGEIPKCVEIYKKLVMVDKVLTVIIAEKVEMGAAGMEIGAELFPEYPHIFFSTIGSGDVIWQRVKGNYEKYKFG